MTTAIAQFMRELERAWDAHREALLVRRDLAAALAPLAAEPSVVHIPAMTGAAGRLALERFYAEQFLPHVPGDLVLSTVSRTVDRWRLVDETTVSLRTTGCCPGCYPGSSRPSGGPRCWPSPSSASSGRGSGPSGCSGITPPWPPSWASTGYWPSSQRPGAMSLRACVGPQEPGAYGAIRGGLDSSGSATFHTAASPSGRVNRERSPISASWISRT